MSSSCRMEAAVMWGSAKRTARPSITARISKISCMSERFRPLTVTPRLGRIVTRPSVVELQVGQLRCIAVALHFLNEDSDDPLCAR